MGMSNDPRVPAMVKAATLARHGNFDIILGLVYRTAPHAPVQHVVVFFYFFFVRYGIRHFVWQPTWWSPNHIPIAC